MANGFDDLLKRAQASSQASDEILSRMNIPNPYDHVQRKMQEREEIERTRNLLNSFRPPEESEMPIDRATPLVPSSERMTMDELMAEFDENTPKDVMANRFKALDVQGRLPDTPALDDTRARVDQILAERKNQDLVDYSRARPRPPEDFMPELQDFNPDAPALAQQEDPPSVQEMPPIQPPSMEDTNRLLAQAQQVSQPFDITIPERDPFALPEELAAPAEEESEPDPVEVKLVKEAKTKYEPKTPELKEIQEEIETEIAKIEPTEEDLNSNLALEDALAARRNARRNAMMARGLAQISAGILGGGDFVVDTKAAMDMIDMAEKYGETPLEEYLARKKDWDERQLRKDKEFERALKRTQYQKELEREAREQDPDSIESQIARSLAKEMLPSMSFEGQTAYTLKERLPMLKDIYTVRANAAAKQQASELANLRMQLSQAERQARAAEREEDRQYRRQERLDRAEERQLARESREAESEMRKKADIIKLFTQETRKLTEAEDKAENAAELINQARRNPASWQALGTQAARALGEVGNLTEQDVARFKGSKAWVAQMKRWFTEGMDGTPPLEDIRDLEELMDVFVEKNREGKRRAARNFAHSYSKAYDTDPDEIYEMLVPGSKMESTFPMTVYKDGQQAQVSNESELAEAQAEGWEPR